jgi:DNA-nicking Smr family endonuclease
MSTEDPKKILAGIRATLAEAQRQQQETARQNALAEAQARRDAGMFRTAVGDATPITPAARPATASKRPPPVPLARRVDAQVATDAIFSDGVDTDLRSGDDAAFARDGVAAQTLRKLRRGDPPVQATLDLHGLNRDQARGALGAFLQHALTDALRCVRVIHGKGTGSAHGQPVLKALVRRWLTQSGQVLAFTSALPGDGGALLVLLQPRGAAGRQSIDP